jgi:hypothetical protein
VAFLVSGLESANLIRLIAVTSPNLIPRPDEVKQHSRETLKGNGCYAGPDREGERTVVVAVHPMSFRAVFESLRSCRWLRPTRANRSPLHLSSLGEGLLFCTGYAAEALVQRKRPAKFYDLLPGNPASGKER